MKIELSEAMSAWVAEHALLYGFDSVDAFVEKILLIEQKRKRGPIEQALLESMAGGEGDEVTPEFWAERRRVRREHQQANQVVKHGATGAVSTPSHP